MRISDWSSDVCSSDLEAIIDGLQVTVPGGYEGTISGTITTTSTEANTHANTVPESGQEPATNDNSRNDPVDYAVPIAGGTVAHIGTASCKEIGRTSV